MYLRRTVLFLTLMAVMSCFKVAEYSDSHYDMTDDSLFAQDLDALSQLLSNLINTKEGQSPLSIETLLPKNSIDLFSEQNIEVRQENEEIDSELESLIQQVLSTDKLLEGLVIEEVAVTEAPQTEMPVVESVNEVVFVPKVDREQFPQIADLRNKEDNRASVPYISMETEETISMPVIEIKQEQNMETKRPMISVLKAPAMENRPSFNILKAPSMDNKPKVNSLEAPTMDNKPEFDSLEAPSLDNKPKVNFFKAPSMDNKPSLSVLEAPSMDNKPKVNLFKAPEQSIFKKPIIKVMSEPETKTQEEIVIKPKTYTKPSPFMLNPFKKPKTKKKLNLKAILDKFAGKKGSNKALQDIYIRFDDHLKKIRKRIKKQKIQQNSVNKPAELSYDEIIQLGGPSLLIGNNAN